MLRTSAIVHVSEVDTLAKERDLVHQLVLRLERRAGKRLSWFAVGPIPIRRGWRSALHTYQVQVMER